MTFPTFVASWLAGSGMRNYTDGPAATAAFQRMMGCDISPDGSTLYIADHAAGAIRTVDTTTGTVGTLWSNGGNGVLDVTVAAGTGNLFVVASDSTSLQPQNGTVKKISPSGVLLATYITRQCMRSVAVAADESSCYAGYGLPAGGWGHGHFCDVFSGADIFVDDNFTMAGGCIVDDDGHPWMSSADFGYLRILSSGGTELQRFQPAEFLGLKSIHNSGGWVVGAVNNARSSHAPIIDFIRRPYTGTWASFIGTPYNPDNPGHTDIIAGLSDVANSNLFCVAGRGVGGNDPEWLYLITSPVFYNNGSSVTPISDGGVPLGTDGGDSCKVFKLHGRGTTGWQVGTIGLG